MSRPKSECGVSLVESMVAIFIATIALSSLGAVIFTATVQNKNQGYETTRMIVFAREKMEEMLELDFADTTSLNGSITDATWEKGLTAGGLADVTQEITTCPGAGAAVGYVQFLDPNGIPLSAASCTPITAWAYTRQWTVTDAPGGVANLKQITVAVFAPAAVNSGGRKPWVILTSYKSQQGWNHGSETLPAPSGGQDRTGILPDRAAGQRSHHHDPDGRCVSVS